jgi:hypothetical protein
LAIVSPAGLRSQTPINQTASKPILAIASHSAEGIELKSMVAPYFFLMLESQTQVLVSNIDGYGGQVDIVSLLSLRPVILRELICAVERVTIHIWVNQHEQSQKLTDVCYHRFWLNQRSAFVGLLLIGEIRG